MGRAALWLVGAALEAVADRQLAALQGAIRRTGARRCATGSGGYSRHPNYFGQWLTWVGYALIALAAPCGWIGLFAPALMLYLILFVTGVPPTEEQALASRGDDYRRYQRETSAFVPWFPKRDVDALIESGRVPDPVLRGGDPRQLRRRLRRERAARPEA